MYFSKVESTEGIYPDINLISCIFHVVIVSLPPAALQNTINGDIKLSFRTHRATIYPTRPVFFGRRAGGGAKLCCYDVYCYEEEKNIQHDYIHFSTKNFWINCNNIFFDYFGSLNHIFLVKNVLVSMDTQRLKDKKNPM